MTLLYLIPFPRLAHVLWLSVKIRARGGDGPAVLAYKIRERIRKMYGRVPRNPSEWVSAIDDYMGHNRCRDEASPCKLSSEDTKTLKAVRERYARQKKRETARLKRAANNSS